jgi:hypothetical protein
MLQSDVVVLIQIVEADDLVATLQQQSRGMKTDKPGGSRDEYPHSGPLLLSA